jgi:hypothetical protein
VNTNRLRDRVTIELILAVVILVGGLGTVIFHTVAHRDVLGFDCGSPINPTEFKFEHIAPDLDGDPMEVLHQAQCQHELRQARDSRTEGFVFTAASLAVLGLIHGIDRWTMSRPTPPAEASGEGTTDHAETGQAESEP